MVKVPSESPAIRKTTSIWPDDTLQLHWVKTCPWHRVLPAPEGCLARAAIRSEPNGPNTSPSSDHPIFSCIRLLWAETWRCRWLISVEHLNPRGIQRFVILKWRKQGVPCFCFSVLLLLLLFTSYKEQPCWCQNIQGDLSHSVKHMWAWKDTHFQISIMTQREGQHTSS